MHCNKVPLIKHIVKWGMTTLTWYLNASWIAFTHLIKFFILQKALNYESNMIAIMLWTCHASKDFKNSFIISNHIFLCKKRILTSKRLGISCLVESCNSLTSIFIVNVIVVKTWLKPMVLWLIHHIS
jgi:hypothetical protein